MSVDIDRKMQSLNVYPLRKAKRRDATESDLVALEEQIGARLPSDYRTFLARHGQTGFYNEDGRVLVTLTEPCPSGNRQPVEEFFGFATDGGILGEIETWRGRTPAKFLPIAEGPGGDVLCMSLQQAEHGRIYFWSHDHAGLDWSTVERYYKELEAAGHDTKQMSTDEAIMAWEQMNARQLPKPPGYSNAYHVADSFSELIDKLTLTRYEE